MVAEAGVLVDPRRAWPNSPKPQRPAWWCCRQAGCTRVEVFDQGRKRLIGQRQEVGFMLVEVLNVRIL